MEPTIILYDLASITGKPFSPNTWQVRLALNYKQLPFKTIWLNMVDIKPTLQPIGALPTVFPAEPDGVYTVPVLVDASGPNPPIVISHTLPIAEYLDSKYPNPPLFPPGTKSLIALFDGYIKENIWMLVVRLVVPKTLMFITECDRTYFRETRERWLESRLEDMSPAGAVREGQWESLKEGLDKLDKLLSMNGKEKVFVLGDQVSQADFIVIALFAWMSSLEPVGWDEVKTWNGGRWGRLWERSEIWRLNQS